MTAYVGLFGNKYDRIYKFTKQSGPPSSSGWTYEEAWPDTNYKGGAHGIAVSPDGKVFTASYYKTNWIAPDTVSTSPIYVFNADGSFVTTIYTVTTGAVTDTLKGNCRGMGVAADGNILYTQSGPSRIFKINYQTLQGMAKHDFTEIGSSPTAPSASLDGTIYVGPVVGGGTTAIATYDTDLNYLGNAVTGPANIARTMTVSPDGLSIYWTMFTGGMGIDIYTRPDELSSFTLTDSLFRGMSIETVAWNPATGNLWVSNDSRGTAGYQHLTWYEYSVTNKAIVGSFTLPDPSPGVTDADKLPRGLNFSPDGMTAYVGLFGNKYDRIYKFSHKPTGINGEGLIVVDGYKLSQNYPNPFNPSTKINFELPTAGYTTLKIYDILGREVAVLIQEELTAGSHVVNFNAFNLASGTYIYQLNVNGTRITHKMILLK
jgi:hypothetical protein